MPTVSESPMCVRARHFVRRGATVVTVVAGGAVVVAGVVVLGAAMVVDR
jgi:hypothetical protein